MSNNIENTEIINDRDKENNIEDDDILYIHTKKIAAFKALIEALKEIFTNINIKFTRAVDKPVDGDPTKTKMTGGMYITAMNSNNSILVRLFLEADKFGVYKCEPKGKNYIVLGVNMSNLFKLIRFLNNDDELIMIYDRNSLNQLNLRYVNLQKKLTTDYYLKLLDLNDDPMAITKQSFDFVISMSSIDFHNLIKNMSVIAENVDIKFVSSKDNKCSLIFSCKGEFAEQISVYNVPNVDTNNENNIINISKNTNDGEQNTERIIQNVYKLESLSLFSRCAPMCQTIELYIKNDYPLIIKYRVADMGTVHIVLSSISNDDQINNDEQEDDNESENNDI